MPLLIRLSDDCRFFFVFILVFLVLVIVVVRLSRRQTQSGKAGAD
jgi:heme/copper-type cytochrome/quinol oxidase subunit 2